jgi:hypothetical protein
MISFSGGADGGWLSKEGAGGKTEAFGDTGEGFSGADLVGAEQVGEKLFHSGDFGGAASQENLVDPGIGNVVSLLEFLNAMPDGTDVRLDEVVELEEGYGFVERDFLEGTIDGGLGCGGEPDFGFFNSLDY